MLNQRRQQRRPGDLVIRHSQKIPSELPVFPMREQVVFPHMAFPLFVPPEQMQVVDAALRRDHLLLPTACFRREGPCRFEHLAQLGTVCRINQVVKFPEGGGKAVIEGLFRAQLVACSHQQPFVLASFREAVEPEASGLVAEALVQSVGSLLKIALAHGRPLPGDAVRMIEQIEDPSRLADLVAVYLNLELPDQQRVLEILDPLERLKDVYLRLTGEVQKLQVNDEIRSEVTKRMGRTQKEYLLREQLKQIQDELGEDDPRQAEVDDLRRRLQEAKMPPPVYEVAVKELRRLERIGSNSPEYTVSRTYLDYLCNMPWSKRSSDRLDVTHAAAVLDEDHYDLKEVKERILEYLSVLSLKADTRGPILCFVGPPGVGKTSLGRSIARATGREFIRLSLGGMKDEAEIRGHRRTYIGALPGRIIREICRCGVSNPVFMLDEVDKIGQDFRGDPASALLEVLDPEQNHSFSDHYLDVPFDLSRVMFITTANIMDPVPSALKDRMEVISLAGYSDEEKRQIAFRHLIPKQILENGLEDRTLKFREDAIVKIIRDYTREAGVRDLERKIAAVCRKVARRITQREDPPGKIDVAEVADMLGPRRYFPDVAAEEDRIGVVTGLAWTEAGGDIIFVEAARMGGEKGLTLTGSLGGVMQESAKTALSFVRGRAGEYQIPADIFSRCDIHIHVPSGAIPKDGPSAGITMATALVSLLTGRPARRDVALTGELTLSGRILPVGGLKEKILAAHRAGVRTVLYPARNQEHLRDLDEAVTREMRLVPVDDMRQVVTQTLLRTASRVPLSAEEEATQLPAP